MAKATTKKAPAAAASKAAAAPARKTTAIKEPYTKTMLLNTLAENTGLTLILALSYGAREEIVDGIKSIIRTIREGHIDEAMITPELVGKHLYTRYYPDPDLLIRTSGEYRLSNFLLWQISYAEIYITRKNWPDFRRDDLLQAIAEYSGRDRRYGGL